MIAKLKAVLIKGGINKSFVFSLYENCRKIKLSYNSVHDPFTNRHNVILTGTI